MRKEDLEESTKLLAQCFCQSEPICLHLKITEKENFDFFYPVVQHGIEKQMSVKCQVRGGNNKILGVIANLPGKDENLFYKDWEENYKYANDINELFHNVRPSEFEYDKAFLCELGGVLKSERNGKIFDGLLLASEKIA